MRLSAIAIRLTASIVLLASFSDYWAYDRWDPTAPMNSSGSAAIPVFDLHGPSGASLHSTDLPDDHCACCSPIVAPPAPVVPLPSLSAASTVGLASNFACALSMPVASSPSPPFSDPMGFGLPLRV
jgi:hypothetical protein